MTDPAHSQAIVLDGDSLTLEDLARIARGPGVRVECSAEALERVRRSREPIERLTAKYREDFEKLERGEEARPVLEYGVTTGFGEFKNIPVAPGELQQLPEKPPVEPRRGAQAPPPTPKTRRAITSRT